MGGLGRVISSPSTKSKISSEALCDLLPCLTDSGHLGSFIERGKDTLKISGVQVSPSELEIALLAQPDSLIDDVAVAGVSGGRTTDEKVPRAWIVLSQAGKRKGAAATIKVLEEWSQKNLTKQKWLRGGFEVIVEVRHSLLFHCEMNKGVDRFRYY